MPDPQEVIRQAKDAYAKWRMCHTIENRTPREMFYHGYYRAIEDLVREKKDDVR